MTIIEALKTLQIRKGELMEYCYGKGYGGVDSAIPQNIANELQERGESLFYYATDCRTSCFQVVNLLDILSEEKKACIIVKALIYKDILDFDYDSLKPIWKYLDGKLGGTYESL